MSIFPYQGEEKDPFGSGKSPEKEEGVSGSEGNPGKAGPFGKEGGNSGEQGVRVMGFGVDAFY